MQINANEAADSNEFPAAEKFQNLNQLKVHRRVDIIRVTKQSAMQMRGSKTTPAIKRRHPPTPGQVINNFTLIKPIGTDVFNAIITRTHSVVDCFTFSKIPRTFTPKIFEKFEKFLGNSLEIRTMSTTIPANFINYVNDCESNQNPLQMFTHISEATRKL